jgi:hypothetical protein
MEYTMHLGLGYRLLRPSKQCHLFWRQEAPANEPQAELSGILKTERVTLGPCGAACCQAHELAAAAAAVRTAVLLCAAQADPTWPRARVSLVAPACVLRPDTRHRGNLISFSSPRCEPRLQSSNAVLQHHVLTVLQDVCTVLPCSRSGVRLWSSYLRLGTVEDWFVFKM